MYLKNKKGVALPLVIILFAVIMIFGTVISNIYLTEGKTAIRHENRTEAYYIARSASDALGTYLINHATQIAEDTGTDSLTERVMDLNIGESIKTDSSEQMMLNGTVEVEIHRRSYSTFEILASGRVNEVSNTASLVLNTSSESMPLTFDNALFANAEMDLDGIDVINGDVAMDEDAEYTEPKNGIINGEVDEDAEFDFPEPSIPIQFEGVVLSGDDQNVANIISKDEVDEVNENIFFDPDEEYMAFGEINYNNETVTIDMTNGDRSIFVHDILLQGGEPVILQGDGTLIVYVENYAEFKQFPKKEDGEPAPASQFLVMLLPGSVVNITANADINGFFYGPSATVTMDTGNVIFTGAIICDGFEGNNGTVNYDEPNADFPLANNVFTGFKYYRWE